MTDLRKAAEGALAVMTAKPSSITAADWADAIDALRAALEHDRRVALNFVHQALQAEASISYVQPDEQTYGFKEPKP